MTGCRARSASLLIHRNLFLLLSRDRNLRGSGMSHATSLSKTIHQGILEGGWHCGQQRKCSMNGVIEWMSLSMPELVVMAFCRKDWKMIFVELSLRHPPSPLPCDPVGQGTELNITLHECACLLMVPLGVLTLLGTFALVSTADYDMSQRFVELDLNQGCILAKWHVQNGSSS